MLTFIPVPLHVLKYSRIYRKLSYHSRIHSENDMFSLQLADSSVSCVAGIHRAGMDIFCKFQRTHSNTVSRCLYVLHSNTNHKNGKVCLTYDLWYSQNNDQYNCPKPDDLTSGWFYSSPIIHASEFLLICFKCILNAINNNSIF